MAHPNGINSRRWFFRYLALSFWLVLTTICGKVAAATPIIQEINMIIGDSRTLKFSPQADMQVSRRGIVSLVHRGEGEWLVTALRAGVVTLTAGENETIQHYILRIQSLDNEANTRTEFINNDLPSWLCSTPGIACDHAARIVRGKMEDAGRFTQAKAWCLHHGCQFLLQLSANARHVMETSIREILSDEINIQLSAGGILRLELVCDSQSRPMQKSQPKLNFKGYVPDDSSAQAIAAALRGRFDEKDIVFVCRNIERPPGYRLETKILRLSDSQLTKLGLDVGTNLSILTTPWRLDAGVQARLDAAQRSHHIETIGEPAIRLIAGQSAEARSGGEFPVKLVTKNHPEGHIVWKPFGMILRVEANPGPDGLIKLNYDLSLSTREEDSVNVQQIKGDINLQPGVPTIVAALDLESSDREQRTPAILGKIPIFGPLFALNTDGKHRSRVLAWFQVTSDETPILRTPGTTWPIP